MNWNDKEEVRAYFKAYRKAHRSPLIAERKAKRRALLRPLKNLPIVELAYIAGLFDGEGSISIVKMAPPSHKNWNPEYALHISLANQHLPTLQSIKAITNLGNIYFDGKDRKGYKWTIGNWRAAEFLKVIMPYFRIKHAQAKLAIQFQSHLHYCNCHRPLTSRQLTKREGMRQQMLNLNRARPKYDSAWVSAIPEPPYQTV